MNGIFAFLLVIVFLVISINFFMLYRRLRRERPGKPGKAAMQEKEAAKWRGREIQRRLDCEQEEAVRRVELRNKTFELYEQVRRKAAAAEKEQRG